MTFWTVGANHFHSVSAVEKVLYQDSFSLKEVLEADDVLQQVLSTNAKLIDYLRQESVIDELVDLVVAPEGEIEKQFKGPDSESKVDADKVENDKVDNDKDSNKTDKETSKASKDSTSTENSNRKEADAEMSDAERDSDELAARNELVDEKLDDDKHMRSDDDVEMLDCDEKSPRDSVMQEPTEESKDSDDPNDEHESNDESNDELNDESNDESDIDQTLAVGEEPVDYAKLATEILSSDMWCIMDSIITNTKAMDKLWELIEVPGKASIKQLTHLTSIFENLLEKRTDLMLEYMRQLPNLTACFINYIDNPPLADLLLKIISTDHPESPTGMINLLYDQSLIPKLVERLAPEIPQPEQMAVGDFLKAFVTISGGNKSDTCSIGPNELSRQLVSEKVMRRLIEIMVAGGSGMCIAVGVIIEIIRKNNTDYDYVQVAQTTLESHPPTPRDSIYLGHMVKLFAQAIPQFQAVLEKETSETLEMPLGPIKPLGFERFRICELYAELLHCSNMALHNDHRGEDIIRERDEHRQRVWHPDQLSGSKEDQKLEDEDKEEEKDASSPTASPPSPPQASPGTANADLNVDSNDANVETNDAEANGEANVEANADTSFETADSDSFTSRLKQQEAQIRQNPVIGDQLKLALNDSRCVSKVFSMLFEYPWNNFLHNVVFDIVQQIFSGSMTEGYNKFLAINLFLQDKITERIVEGQKANDEYEASRKTRLGYVGHLTLISEEVVKFSAMFTLDSVAPGIADALENPDWVAYVNHTLLRLREQYNLILGGRKPDDVDGMDDEDRYSDDTAMGGSAGPIMDDEDDANEDDEDDEDAEDYNGGRFRRYMKDNGADFSKAGNWSSDEEEPGEEWETVPKRDFKFKGDDDSCDDSGDDSCDDSGDDSGNDDDSNSDEEDLSLVRSRSYAR